VRGGIQFGSEKLLDVAELAATAFSGLMTCPVIGIYVHG
jgi:hypothetical protein